MTLKDGMKWKTYSDAFWGPEFRSTAGAEALTKRNGEGKKMCSEFEDYLRKRSKLEAHYSKTMSSFTKCFRDWESTGVLEASFAILKEELEEVARAHQTASDHFQKQADAVKKFKEEQSNMKKSTENVLHKAQELKLSQHTKTLNLQKTYEKKSVERDNAEITCKDISISSQAGPKEVERARNKVIKAEEDAQKSDSAYKGAVMVLDDCRLQWEKEMLHACQICQELDEERLQFLRKELWYTVNVDSKIALDVDNSCEKVRDVLEKCDIMTEIQVFIQNSATGPEHPEPFVYQHYSKLTSGSDSDSNSNSGTSSDAYATISDVAAGSATAPASIGVSSSTTIQSGAKSKFPNMLTFPKKIKKKSSSSEEHQHNSSK